MNKLKAIIIAELALEEAERSLQAHLKGYSDKKLAILPVDVLRTLLDMATEQDTIVIDTEAEEKAGGLMEKTFEFTVVLQGTGKDIDEAWEDAIVAFEQDPGTYASANEIP